MTLNKERHFWAKAKGHQIANWIREKKDGGSIVQPEMPMRFSQHMKSTSDSKEIKFIKASVSFRDGQVIEVDSVEAGMKLTAQVEQMLRVTTISSTDETLVQPAG